MGGACVKTKIFQPSSAGWSWTVCSNQATCEHTRHHTTAPARGRRQREREIERERERERERATEGRRHVSKRCLFLAHCFPRTHLLVVDEHLVGGVHGVTEHRAAEPHQQGLLGDQALELRRGLAQDVQVRLSEGGCRRRTTACGDVSGRCQGAQQGGLWTSSAAAAAAAAAVCGGGCSGSGHGMGGDVR
jgi:hypothetical protein